MGTPPPAFNAERFFCWECDQQAKFIHKMWQGDGSTPYPAVCRPLDTTAQHLATASTAAVADTTEQTPGVTATITLLFVNYTFC